MKNKNLKAQNSIPQVLVASVLFNILLLGVILAVLIHTPGQPDGEALNLEGMSSANRQMVEEGFATLHQLRETKRSAVEKARQNIRALLATDPLDEKALDAAEADLRQINLTAMEKTGEKVKAMAKQLPLSDRKIMVKAMARLYPPAHPAKPEE